MRLFIEGHNVRRGYEISRIWSDAECSVLPPPTASELAPLRYYTNIHRARRLVERFNRRFGS